MATELIVHEGNTANWAFTLKRGGRGVNLTSVSAALTIPFLGIADAVMDMDGADGLATYSPNASDTDDKPVYRTPAFVVVTFADEDESTETFPFDITVKPHDYWSRISPTTSTSTSTSTSTTTTTLP